jgi:hypothetical protein
VRAAVDALLDDAHRLCGFTGRQSSFTGLLLTDRLAHGFRRSGLCLKINAHTLELLHIKAADGGARTRRGSASIKILGDEERPKRNSGLLNPSATPEVPIRNKESWME